MFLLEKRVSSMVVFARGFLCFLLFSVCLETAFAKSFKVGLVLDKAGREDRSFNEAALKGLKKAKKELGIKSKDVVAADDHAFEVLLRNFARKKYDLIISVGFAQKMAIDRVSAKFPKKNFVLLDATSEQPNVRNLMFHEHEGSFLVGALAAMKSKKKQIGFVGGMDIPLVRKFAVGFTEGAKYIDPKIKVISNYVGVTAAAWIDPAKGKELALTQYKGGADIIFAAAGASGLGVFDAAEEYSLSESKKPSRFVIGVDANQNWIKPGYVLTSMLKRVDRAIFDVIKEAKEGSFAGGTRYFSLKDDGIGFAIDKHNRHLISKSDEGRLLKIRRDIIAGKIKVSDYTKTYAEK